MTDLAGEIHHLRVRRNLHAGRAADRGDSAVANENCLIVARRGAGAVDDADVRERERALYRRRRTHAPRAQASAGRGCAPSVDPAMISAAKRCLMVSWWKRFDAEARRPN